MYDSVTTLVVYRIVLYSSARAAISKKLPVLDENL